tara:strand:- start:1321 stop:1647 length:327 start_codon:yes stop_codon:yes gene_type:complete
VQDAPINSRTGKLVTLKPGTYLTSPSSNEYQGISYDVPNIRPINPVINLEYETSALLFECIGPISSWGNSTNKQKGRCWHALVDGKVLLVWDDCYLEENKQPIIKSAG